MPPRDVERPKRKREYEHIKEPELKRAHLKRMQSVLLRQQLIKLEEKKEKQKANRLSLKFFYF